MQYAWKWKVKRCVLYAVTVKRHARSQSFQDSAVNNKNHLAKNNAENENEYAAKRFGSSAHTGRTCNTHVRSKSHPLLVDGDSRYVMCG